MGNFGALTDHFGILAIVDGAGDLGDVLKLVDSSATPASESRADAQDENGDIAASTFYGAGDISEASSTFALVTGDLDTELISLGEVVDGKCITSVEISTSNDGWPQITVSGTLGAETMVAPTGLTNKFAMPTLEIIARKQAQPMGFTVGETCKLTGSSLSASVDLAQQEDGLGEPVAHGVSGGTFEVSADFVRITAAPSWTVTAPGIGLTETQAPGESEGQAAYHTGTGTAAGTLVRTAA